MAVDDAIGTSLFIDYSNFAEGIKQANKLIKLNEAQFQSATAGMDDWSKSSDGLEAKLKQLNSNLDVQRKKVEQTSQEYERIKQEKGENSKAAIDLATKLAKEQAALAKTEKEIRNNTKALDSLGSESQETEKDIDGLKKSLNSLSDTTVKGIVGLGTAVAGLAAAFLATAESTKEYRTAMGQLDTAFQASGHSATEAKDTYNDLYSILGDTGKANEASLQLAKLAKDEQDLSQYTNILTGVYATFGDSLPVEGLAEAMNHTAKLGSVQGNLADALEWSGVNVDDFNAQLESMNSEEERAQLIQSTLNGLYGETAEKYRENNAEIIANNEAQAQLNETLAQVGALAEPIITEIKTIGAELAVTLLPILEKTINFVKENGTAIVAVVAGITTAIVAYTVAQKAMAVAANIAKIAQVGLNAALIANPIGLVVTAIGALVTAFIILWNKSEAFRNFFIKMWETIKYALGTYLLAIVSAFYATVDAIVAAWNGTVEFFQKIGKAISDAFIAAWEAIKFAWSKVTDFFGGIKDNIIITFQELPDKLKTIGKNLVEGLWNGIDNMTDWIKEKIGGFSKKVLDGIKNFFGVHSPSTETEAIGEHLDEGLANGIKNKTGEVLDAAKEQATQVVDTMYDNLENRLGDNSGVVKTIGFLLGKNISDGIEKGVGDTASSAIGNGLKKAANSDGFENTSAVGVEVGKSVGESVQSGVEGGLSTLDQTLTNCLSSQNFESLFKGDWQGLGMSLGDSVIGGLSMALSAGIGNPFLGAAVSGLIGGLWSMIKGIFSNDKKSEESTYHNEGTETKILTPKSYASHTISYSDDQYQGMASGISSLNSSIADERANKWQQYFVLNQTNNSPKALSPTEIYRQSNKAVRLLAQGARA